MKGLIVNIYHNEHGDFTIEGLSSRHDTLTLIGEGIEGPFEPGDESPAVTLVKRDIGGEIYIHAVPCDKNANPLPGWYMAGGNFIYTSDSRFPSRQPISIHDRQEF